VDNKVDGNEKSCLVTQEDGRVLAQVAQFYGGLYEAYVEPSHNATFISMKHAKLWVNELVFGKPIRPTPIPSPEGKEGS
jgi:hypothetical protein